MLTKLNELKKYKKEHKKTPKKEANNMWHVRLKI